MLKRYLAGFILGVGLAAWVWLPSGPTQIGELPFRLRLMGFSSVLGGPIGGAFWELLYGRSANAVIWTIAFVIALVGMIGGVRLRQFRGLRIVGYCSVALWVFMGFAWSVSGL
jgi:hypothetical protein